MSMVKLLRRHLNAKKSFLIGVAFSVHLALLAGVGLVALVPRPVDAQDQTACFTATECLKDNGQADQRNCTNEAPCCNDTVCFYTDASCGNNQGRCLAKSPSTKLTVQIGSATSVVDLSDYIALLYRYSVAVAGVIAGVMIMIGGVQYLIARGDAGRVTKARERITNSVIGLVLVLGAFLLLQTVNPDLVTLRLPKIPIVKSKPYGFCTQTEICFPCGMKYGIVAVTAEERASPPKGCNDPRLTSELSKPGVAFTCIGKGCPGAKPAAGFSGCSDATQNCRTAPDPKKVPDCGSGSGGSTDTAAAAAQAGERYLCLNCIADGVSCAGKGNEMCCSGFCGASGCSTGQVGSKCSSGADCKTGICTGATRFLGKSCSTGEAGTPCSGAEDCKPGYKCTNDVIQPTLNVCTPGTFGSACASDQDCVSPNTCRKIEGLVASICATPGEDIACSKTGNTKCPSGKACVVGEDNPQQNEYGGSFCSDRTVGSYCQVPQDCVSQKCVESRCVDGLDGSLCKVGTDCNSGKCLDGEDYKFCVSGSAGSSCKGDPDCLSDFKCLIGNNVKVGRCILRAG